MPQVMAGFRHLLVGQARIGVVGQLIGQTSIHSLRRSSIRPDDRDATVVDAKGAAAQGSVGGDDDDERRDTNRMGPSALTRGHWKYEQETPAFRWLEA